VISWLQRPVQLQPLPKASERELAAIHCLVLGLQAQCSQEELHVKKSAFVAELKTLPIAVHTAEANEQHYEVRHDGWTGLQVAVCMRMWPVNVADPKHCFTVAAYNMQVPTEYYLLCLGKHLKYSSCLYRSDRDTLSQAEANMLGKRRCWAQSTGAAGG
jgi:hypothetical protein